MRYWIFFLILPGLLAGEGTKAQKKNLQGKIENPLEYSFVLKTNPLPMFWGPIPWSSEFRLVNEFVVARNQSSEIGVSLLGKSPVFFLLNPVANPGINRIIVRGFRFQIAHKFFINNLMGEGLGMQTSEYAPKGFYLGPLFSYSTARISDRFNNQFDRYLRISHTNLNLIAGHQWITGSGIVFDLFTGFGYKENHWFNHFGPQGSWFTIKDMSGHYRSNLKLILGFNAGIAF